MEITLTRQGPTEVAVSCDGRASHTFDLLALVPGGVEGPPQPLDDPVAYGRALYQALFPPIRLPARRSTVALSVFCSW